MNAMIMAINTTPPTTDPMIVPSSEGLEVEEEVGVELEGSEPESEPSPLSVAVVVTVAVAMGLDTSLGA